MNAQIFQLHMNNFPKLGACIFYTWASQVVQLVKIPPANVRDKRDKGLILDLGRSPGEGNGNPLQYSYPGKTEDPGMAHSIGLQSQIQQCYICMNLTAKIQNIQDKN